jgi:hypothetical protein
MNKKEIEALVKENNQAYAYKLGLPSDPQTDKGDWKVAKKEEGDPQLTKEEKDFLFILVSAEIEHLSKDASLTAPYQKKIFESIARKIS